MKITKRHKSNIAKIWLVFSLYLAMQALDSCGYTHRNYGPNVDLCIIQTDDGLEIIPQYPDPDQSLIAFVFISSRPTINFKIFNTWISSIGVNQMGVSYIDETQPTLTQSEIRELIVEFATLHKDSDPPIWELDHLQHRGMLHMIANNISETRFHPTNILLDLFILTLIGFTLWSFMYLCKEKYEQSLLRSTNKCPKCEYPTDGLPATTLVCPECGHPRTPSLNAQSTSEPALEPYSKARLQTMMNAHQKKARAHTPCKPELLE